MGKQKVVGHPLSECEQNKLCRSDDLGLPKPFQIDWRQCDNQRTEVHHNGDKVPKIASAAHRRQVTAAAGERFA